MAQAANGGNMIPNFHNRDLAAKQMNHHSQLHTMHNHGQLSLATGKQLSAQVTPQYQYAKLQPSQQQALMTNAMSNNAAHLRRQEKSQSA